MKLRSLLVILSIVFSSTLFGQFTNTLSYDEAQSSPTATIQDVSWIAGHWKGEALGGITEEMWSPPLGGSMMCTFKLVVDDLVKFYEIVTLSEVNNTLILKLKHFHSDLKGWEEKDETLDFKLVKVTPNKVYFDGFTFEKVSENEINVYVVFENHGESKEMKFNYHRVQ